MEPLINIKHIAEHTLLGGDYITEGVDDFIRNHPDEYKWLEDNKDKSSFAQSLLSGLKKYGGLTTNQLNAVRKSLEKMKKLDQIKPMEVSQTHGVKHAFDTAKQAGILRPKMRLDGFVFSSAPETGRNPGFIYVKGIDDSTYLGKIADGKFFRSLECDDTIAQRVVDAMNDPEKAAVAYGKKYGKCSMCGRTLEDHISITMSMGPTCAKRYGFTRSRKMLNQESFIEEDGIDNGDDVHSYYQFVSDIPGEKPFFTPDGEKFKLVKAKDPHTGEDLIGVDAFRFKSRGGYIYDIDTFKRIFNIDDSDIETLKGSKVPSIGNEIEEVFVAPSFGHKQWGPGGGKSGSMRVFKMEHPEVYNWIQNNKGKSRYAKNCNDLLNYHGNLNSKQIQTIKYYIEKGK